jgi:hypothetical protein
MITNLHNNQLKEAAATVTEMATMTATTMVLKMKAAALLTAAWRWQKCGRGGQHGGTAVAVAAAAQWQRQQLGGSATLELAAALWEVRQQRGGGSGSAAAAAAALRWRAAWQQRWQLGGSSLAEAWPWRQAAFS